MAFVHLHTHTAYSLLDGEGTIPKLIDRAKELGQTALSITDHGNMYGVIEFYEYAVSQGIKPVLGCEVYVAPRRLTDKVHELDSTPSHLILLAENNVGYKNLMNIVSTGFTEGFYYKPRVDKELLKANSEGIIALSGCMFGVISRHLLNGDTELAEKETLDYIEIFGRENFFIELQDHGIFEQKKLNSQLIKLANKLNLNVCATNDIHYVKKSDSKYQDVLMCIQTGKTVDDPDRMKMVSSELYLKSEDEMAELFSYIPEALENTAKIAERCNVEIEFGHLHLPKFDLPSGCTSEEYLRQKCIEGYNAKFDSDIYMDRLNYELATIEEMGYVDYFLIVWDFISFAKRNKIMVGPGRGSAAGSLVSYCLGITNVNPMKYGLIFERFLNPERVTMPDIDIDFCYERRQEVIDYVIEKYGEDRVAQIITFGTMAARLAIRDTGRALNIPYSVVDSIAKEIPYDHKITISKALEVNPALKEKYDNNQAVKNLIDTALELEGLPRHASTHAAGVVITNEPVKNYVPLQKNDDVVTTQFTMTTIERLGLLKMDFLGLRTLTVIRDAVSEIYKNHGIKIDIDNLVLDDKDVYKMISNGDTDGVFQLESGGMKQFMKELKPDSLEDIIAGISLYRPGPMDSIPKYIANKNHEAEITYKHKSLEKILDVTYGCIVYQEQVMQIVRELGGYSLGRADLVRRAMSKKKTDVMEQERINFIHGIKNADGSIEVEGAVRRGIPENTAAEIFDEMMDFAKYAFNKSHAAAYAVVAYQTAYLKYHFKTEFFAALLTSVLGSPNQITKYINVAKKLKINVLPPDINESEDKFTVNGNSIRFGLLAVKNVGHNFAKDLTNERIKNGAFTSFTDFVNRMLEFKINKKMVEALILCGAFDSLKLKRSVLMNVYESIIDGEMSGRKSIAKGQLDMFSEGTDIDTDNFPDIPEFSAKDMLDYEKEYMGIYVSGHPLDSYKTVIEKNSTVNILDILENENHRFSSGDNVKIAGMLSKIRKQLTKRGELMLYAVFEDLSGSIEVIIFPNKVRAFESLIKADSLVIVEGNLDVPDDREPKIRLESLLKLNTSEKKLYLKLNSTDTENFESIKTILANSNGDTPVIIYYADTKTQLKAPKSMWINENTDLPKIQHIKDILGNNCVVIK